MWDGSATVRAELRQRECWTLAEGAVDRAIGLVSLPQTGDVVDFGLINPMAPRPPPTRRLLPRISEGPRACSELRPLPKTRLKDGARNASASCAGT
jgi:hypothetical protein